jgi:hypothetical protein
MNRIPTLLSLLPLAILGLSLPAHADKVFLKATSSAATGNANDFIEGKVLEENKDQVVLRVEGGQMTLSRTRIARIEKDALAVKDIEDRESKASERLAQADEARLAVQGQWAEASAKLRAEQSQGNTGAEEVRIVVDFQGMFGNYVFRAYDPILRKMDFQRMADLVDIFLRSEVRRLTGRDNL